MARSYFTLARAATPGRFEYQPAGDGKLMAMNNLWDESSTLGGALLLLRVRSDKPAPAVIGADDSIEWVCGLIDTTTRWRCAANLIRVSLQAIRPGALSQACWQAFGMLAGRHQAAITMPERQGAAKSIRDLIEGNATNTMVAAFEHEIAHALMRYCFADNEFEALALLPHMPMFALNLASADVPDGRLRTGSVTNLLSSALMNESFVRLTERMPEWLYAPMPALAKTPAVAAPVEETEDEPPESDDIHEGSTT